MNKKFGISVQKSSSRLIHLQLGLAFLAQLFSSSRVHGENQVDYRYEYYDEDNNRMRIETHSVYFEQKLIDAVTAKGELVYDGISGSTPSGTYKFPASAGKIILDNLHDIRRAVNLNFDCQLGNQTLTPGFAYSKESDYESYGLSLNDAITFNDKNTILQFGISHNFDSVLNELISGAPRAWQDKASTEAIIGISQLLTPKTIFSANFTFGYESGFLSDPYRLTEFVYPGHQFGVVRNENRPGVLSKEIFLTSITQFIQPLNASIEGSYRFYHDSYDVYANTLSLTWHQWLGKHVILEPAFRFYEQSSASFYSPLFQTDPASVNYFSSDYRLSEFYSLDAGIQATVIVNDHLRLIAGYHRYEMHGLDDTVAAMYPQANIFTVGLSILW